MQSNATHRDGQRGYASAPDANGFCTFESETGARFSVYDVELTRDAHPAEREAQRAKVRAGWPEGCLHFAAHRLGGVLSEFTIIRTRPGQTNAKHSPRVDDAIREGA